MTFGKWFSVRTQAEATQRSTIAASRQRVTSRSFLDPALQTLDDVGCSEAYV